MMFGSVLMEGTVPDFDATVVDRILDAGKGMVVNRLLIFQMYVCGASLVLNIKKGHTLRNNVHNGQWLWIHQHSMIGQELCLI